MPTELLASAQTLQAQLLDLGVEASALPNNDSITLQLSPAAAQTLSGLLDSAHKPRLGEQETAADQEWEATSERVSEIEGFTGGEASD
jgi:hypothetical protein